MNMSLVTSPGSRKDMNGGQELYLAAERVVVLARFRLSASITFAQRKGAQMLGLCLPSCLVVLCQLPVLWSHVKGFSKLLFRVASLSTATKRLILRMSLSWNHLSCKKTKTKREPPALTMSSLSNLSRPETGSLHVATYVNR